MTAIPLGETWLGCVLVSSRDGTTLPPGREREVDSALSAHLATLPRAVGNSVWFDVESGVCFSAAQLRNGPTGKDYNFLAEADEFLDGVRGLRYVEGSISSNDVFRALPLCTSTECIHAVTSRLEAVRDKRVLIVLGGPTTNRVAWERVEADSRWSCNNFYMNPQVAELALDVVALAPDVRLHQNPELRDYLDDHDTHVVFEIDRGGPVGSWRPVNQFVADYPARCAFYHLRYQSAIGLGARMILFTILLGAKEVAFVGLDGMTDRGPLHAFEPYKDNPVWYDKYGPALQRRQYVVFWEYVLSLCESTKCRLYNLGESCEVNLSRTITQRCSPLPQEMARAVARR